MAPPWAAEFRARCAAAWAQVTWAEASGAVGDVGTFLPLLIGLVQKLDLDLGTTLIATGVYNIVSGWQFGIPMCVQPMKTIAAVALSASTPALTLPQLLLAGVFVGGTVGLLGASRAIDVFNWAIPQPVIRGVQLAVGAKLAMKGVDTALRHRVVPPGGGAAVAAWRPWLGVEGLLLGCVALAALVVTTVPPRVAAPGSEAAVDEGGLGPRPTDTPFEPLLRRLLPAPAAGGVGSAACSVAAGDGPRGGGDEGARLLPGGGASGHSSSGGGDDAEAGVVAVAADATDASGRGDCGGGGAQATAATTSAAAGASPSLGACGGGAAGGCGGGGGGGVAVPAALAAVALGLLLAAVSQPSLLGKLRLGPSVPRLLRPTWPDFRAGVLRAGLAQLPLTALNSVIAVSALADSLFPRRPDAARWRPSSVALSVAAMNVCGCWLGAMPCCHGAGGLAAQHKFGGRSGAASVILGCGKLFLGLALGSSLAALLAAFPGPLLGSLLAVSGVELAAAVRHTRSARGYGFALFTAVAILALDDTGVGFLVGLAAVVMVSLYEAVGAWVRVAAAARGLGYGNGGGMSGWRKGLLHTGAHVLAVGSAPAREGGGRGDAYSPL